VVGIIIAINHILEHLFILLDQPTAAVIAQNKEENILIVGEMGYTFDFINLNMSMLMKCFLTNPK
jgi:hypothetical protein